MRMMPTNRSSLKAIALAVLLGSGGVGAQDDPWYSGIRSDGGPGNTSLGFRGSLPGEFSMGGASPENLAAQKQFGGYRFTDSLAIEGTQTNFGLQGSNCAGDSPTMGASRNCYGSTWSLAGVATLPFESGLSIYGRLGLHYWQKNGAQEDPGHGRNADDIGGVLGVGVSFEWSRRITFHAESEHYNELSGSNAMPGANLGLDASVHSIGLSIKF